MNQLFLYFLIDVLRFRLAVSFFLLFLLRFRVFAVILRRPLRLIPSGIQDFFVIGYLGIFSDVIDLLPECFCDFGYFLILD